MDVHVIRQRLALAARAGLAELLPGLQALEYEPASIAPPTFYSNGPAIDYFPERMPGSIIQHTIMSKLLVGNPDDKAAHKRLDAVLSGGLLRAALEADRTLGGACNDLLVRRVTEYGPHEIASAKPYLGVNIETHVWGTDT